MSEPFTYLDYNATAPVRPEVREAVSQALAMVGNPSSVHWHGRLARGLVERARESLAHLLGASPQDIIFTSGGTEANNLGLGGLLKGFHADRLVVSAIEHESVLGYARAGGLVHDVVPATKEGVIDLDELEKILEDHQDKRLVVSVMYANNETGVLQPVSNVVAIAQRHNALVHCDAIQAVGKVGVNFGELGVHALSVSAHKFGGPQGVGALVVRADAPLERTSFGGGQELGRRAGTENVPGIAGLGSAAELALQDADHMRRVGQWRDAMEQALLEVASDATIFSRSRDRLPTTTCIAFPDWPAESQVIALDLAGVSISAGSACSSGKIQVSHVLCAMGVAPDEALSTIRISFGWDSREADANRFIDVWSPLYCKRFNRTGRKFA